MSIDKVLEEYRDVVRSDVFVRYEKQFADKIVSELSKGYLGGLPEPRLVETVEGIVNSVHNFSETSHQPYFEISTRSIFIHGNKSQVQFKYYGNWVNSIELGDLIFIISVVHNGKKHFEKITTNQFKKEKSSSKRISWGITNKKQLYLLSRFPPFRGVKGLVPKRMRYLPNNSGCLGSYGLLYEPGDFAFVSATGLDSFMGDRKTLKMKELHNLSNITLKGPFYWCETFCPLNWHILGNCHFSNDVFSFVHEYLRANIGESVFSRMGIDNPQVRIFLGELISIIESKARREKSEDMLNFVNEFRRFPYFDIEGLNQINRDIDPEGGGIGIIHTTIDLGE